MRGISRTSLAEVEERLTPLTLSPETAMSLGEELFSVAGVLASSGTETDPAAENEIFCARFCSA